MFSHLGKTLIQELEAPQVLTKPGTGWISGVLGLFLAMAGLVAVICLRYPQLLTAPELRAVIDLGLFRIFLHGLLITGFLLATMSLILRQNKFLGLTAVTLILIAVSLGGSKTT
ncbi:MAG: sterol desaturase family protein, partial [Gammaproteobacteria bacterium]|nr:sterol desaturase family protein [Gammaproteobacteria bacterium]